MKRDDHRVNKRKEDTTIQKVRIYITVCVYKREAGMYI